MSAPCETQKGGGKGGCQKGAGKEGQPWVEVSAWRRICHVEAEHEVVEGFPVPRSGDGGVLAEHVEVRGAVLGSPSRRMGHPQGLLGEGEEQCGPRTGLGSGWAAYSPDTVWAGIVKIVIAPLHFHGTYIGLGWTALN